MKKHTTIDYGLLSIGLPFIIIDVCNNELCFLLDTDSDKNLITQKLYKQLQSNLPPHEYTGYTSPSNHLPDKPIEVDIPFILEDMQFDEPFVCLPQIDRLASINALSGIEIQGILGNDFFLKHGWIIDFDK